MDAGRPTVTKYRLPAHLVHLYSAPNPPAGAELVLMAISTAITAALFMLLLAPVLPGEVRTFVAAPAAVLVVALIRYSPYIVRRIRLAIARRRYEREANAHV